MLSYQVIDEETQSQIHTHTHTHTHTHISQRNILAKEKKNNLNPVSMFLELIFNLVVSYKDYNYILA